MICAGLLHSCNNIDDFNNSDIYKQILSINSEIYKIISLYSTYIRNESYRKVININSLDIYIINVILLSISNELEMYISKEYVIDKTWNLSPNILNSGKIICEHLNIPNLYHSLHLAKNKL
jgi:hypothetical protein